MNNLTYPFAIVFSITLLVYLLRGFGILTLIPGGIILILLGFSIVIGILYGVEKTKRF